MRIDAATFQGLVTSITDLNTRQTDIASQLSSGLRLTSLSDDPAAAAQAAIVADSLQRADSFLASASTVGNRLQAADTALSSVVTQLTPALSTAVGTIDGTLTASNRATVAAQLISIRESLLSLANSNYSGSYLFSGTSTQTPFTEASDGTVTYAGNALSAAFPIDAGGSVQSSVIGSAVFTATGASVFGALNDFITNLQNNTIDAGNAATLTGALRDALTNVTTQRAGLNTTQGRLSDESDYATARKTDLQVEQSTLLSDDPVALATELSAVTTQRSALLSTIALVQKGSLFDYL